MNVTPPCALVDVTFMKGVIYMSYKLIVEHWLVNGGTHHDVEFGDDYRRLCAWGANMIEECDSAVWYGVTYVPTGGVVAYGGVMEPRSLSLREYAVADSKVLSERRQPLEELVTNKKGATQESNSPRGERPVSLSNGLWSEPLGGERSESPNTDFSTKKVRSTAQDVYKRACSLYRKDRELNRVRKHHLPSRGLPSLRVSVEAVLIGVDHMSARVANELVGLVEQDRHAVIMASLSVVPSGQVVPRVNSLGHVMRDNAVIASEYEPCDWRDRMGNRWVYVSSVREYRKYTEIPF